MRECATCLKSLSDDQFYKSPRYRCKPCHRAYVRAWQQRNKERVNAANRRYRERAKNADFFAMWRSWTPELRNAEPRILRYLVDALGMLPTSEDIEMLNGHQKPANASNDYHTAP